MVNALNRAKDNMKEMISSIIEHAEDVSAGSEELSATAEESSLNVNYIKNIIGKVQNAFVNLSGNSKDLLTFINSNVKSDYELLINTGERYERDSNKNSLSQYTWNICCKKVN